MYYNGNNNNNKSNNTTTGNNKPINNNTTTGNKGGKLVSWSNKSLAMNTTILSNNKADLFHVQMWRKTKWGHIIKQPGTEVGKRFGIGHKKHKQVRCEVNTERHLLVMFSVPEVSARQGV